MSDRNRHIAKICAFFTLWTAAYVMMMLEYHLGGIVLFAATLLSPLKTFDQVREEYRAPISGKVVFFIVLAFVVFALCVMIFGPLPSTPAIKKWMPYVLSILWVLCTFLIIKSLVERHRATSFD
jgi:hypothetical protein